MSIGATNGGSRTSETKESLLPLALILVGVLVLVPFFMFLGRGDGLGNTQIGLDGLEVWLRQNGVRTVAKPPRGKDPAWRNILRIVPVYDADPTSDDEKDLPERERRLGSVTQRPLDIRQFEAKAADGPTLAVLPKWRSGLIDLGKAHPSLLIPGNAIHFYGDAVKRFVNRGFGQYRLVDGKGQSIGIVTAYSLQVLGDDLDEDCDPIATIADIGTVLAKCEDMGVNRESFIVLSDPDLIDNHGLALGDNAAVALKLVAAAGGPPAGVFIDNTVESGAEARSSADENGTAQEGEDQHQRSLGDLSRFFQYPFSYVWAGFVVLTGLAMWRGIWRFGPPIAEGDGGDSSKKRTIEAAGRILHLAGTERDLIQAHVQARLEAIAAALLPPRRASDAGVIDEIRIERVLHRRDPRLAKQFALAVVGVTDAKAGQHERLGALDLFERTLQEIWNEFGRSANSSRQDRR